MRYIISFHVVVTSVSVVLVGAAVVVALVVLECSSSNSLTRSSRAPFISCKVFSTKFHKMLPRTLCRTKHVHLCVFAAIRILSM